MVIINRKALKTLNFIYTFIKFKVLLKPKRNRLIIISKVIRLDQQF